MVARETSISDGVVEHINPTVFERMEGGQMEQRGFQGCRMGRWKSSWHLFLSTVIIMHTLTELCSKYSIHGPGLKIGQGGSRSKNRSYRVARQIIYVDRGYNIYLLQYLRLLNSAIENEGKQVQKT